MRAKLTAGLLCAAGMIFGQAAPARIAFEVASVKPFDIASMKMAAGGGFRFSVGTKIEGNKVDIAMASFADLVCQAYRIKNYQLTGPDWMSRERFEIHAKMPDGSTKEQVPEMLQSLLADRFKMTFHQESKEHQVYALTVGKGGSKLKEVEPDPPVPDGAPGSSAPVRTMSGFQGPSGDSNSSAAQTRVYTRLGDGNVKAVGGASNGSMHFDQKMKMEQLCNLLNGLVDRPVVDMTELTATYKVVLDIPTDQILNMAKAKGNVVAIGGGPTGGDASEPADNSAIFAAVQKMGLKLDPRKAPLALIVVDRADKLPTEN